LDLGTAGGLDFLDFAIAFQDIPPPEDCRA
jgi:hypothetical protein